MNAMIVRKPLEVILYLGLLMGAVIFVQQTIEEYRDGATSFIVTQEPISLSDLPTLTICWNRKKNPFPEWYYNYIFASSRNKIRSPGIPMLDDSSVTRVWLNDNI